MSDWSAGYVADIDYTYGYYSELNPLRTKLALINAGLQIPTIRTACELGFGQGVSANMHAAATETHWYGTDFNPAQAGFAQELANTSGANAHFHDEAFSDFCSRTDLPDFDYIGLHGIWSWISDENRALIVDFVRRKLRVGGVLYISYNTLPGWAPFVPVRNLMTQYASRMCADGLSTGAKVEDTLAFIARLLQANPKYLRANPLVADKFNQVNGQNRHYLAHEYFNRDWFTTSFSAIAELMHSAKLSFACSAHYLDHVSALHMSPEQRQFLEEIKDQGVREDTRDLMINQSFRRDYWIKGARRLKPIEQLHLVRSIPVVLTTHAADISLEITGALGKANLTENVYKPIIAFLADHQPRSIGDIESAVASAGLVHAQVVEVCMVLVGLGHMQLVSEDAPKPAVHTQVAKLNRHIMDKAHSGDDVLWLASPLTGAAISISRFEQIFADAVLKGQESPAQMARFAWQVLKALNQKIIKESKTLETEEENLAELELSATTFANAKLPVLRATGIIKV